MMLIFKRMLFFKGESLKILSDLKYVFNNLITVLILISATAERDHLKAQKRMQTLNELN